MEIEKSRQTKQILGGMSPTSGHHVGVKLLSFQVGVKVPTTHGYHLKPLELHWEVPNKFFPISSLCKNETTLSISLFASFNLAKK
jgi:hypothetical protein